MAASRSKKTGVGTTSTLYEHSRKDMQQVLDVLQGTQHMRSCGKTYLPKEPQESEAAYSLRKNRTFLFNMTKGALRSIVSQPFRKKVQVVGEEKLPEQFADFVNNVDGRGSDVSQFANDAFEAMVGLGHAFIFIDFTAVNQIAGSTAVSKATEKSMNARAVFKLIRKADMLAWRHEIVKGQKTLTMVKFREVRLEAVDAYSDEEREYIYIWTPNTFEIWRCKDPVKCEETVLGRYLSTWPAPLTVYWQTNFELVGEGTHSYPDGIPLVPLYANRIDDFSSEPPLLELSNTNIEHWQSSSDQRNILRFARMARLAVSGATQKEMESAGTASVNAVMAFKDPNAKAYYVEHSGKAIEAGERDLATIEERGKAQGARPMLEKTIDSTATEALLNMSVVSSDAEAWVQELEIALKKAMAIALKWTNQELHEEFAFHIACDFTVASGSRDDFKFVAEAQVAGLLSKKTTIMEMIRRGILADTVDPDSELQNAEEEAPDLTPIPLETDVNDDDNPFPPKDDKGEIGAK